MTCPLLFFFDVLLRVPGERGTRSARRGMFWYGVFGDAFGGWKLYASENFSAIIPSDAVVATPHWQQTSALRDATKSSHRWIEGDQFPTAHAIAHLARAKQTSEPLEPIYLPQPV